MSTKLYYEFFRKTSVGSTLLDTLDEMVLENRIEPQIAMTILTNFDKAMADALALRVNARLKFKGHLHNYRNCDDVWTFDLTNVEFTLDNQSNLQADNIKIVSCSSRGFGGQ